MNTETNIWDDPDYPWGEDLARDLYKIEYDERKKREQGAARAGLALPRMHLPSSDIEVKLKSLHESSFKNQHVNQDNSLENINSYDTIGGMNNNFTTKVSNQHLTEAEDHIMSGKPDDPWTCGIDRQTGRPKCVEYPDYYNSLDQDELDVLKNWETNTSDYIKRLQRSNDARAQTAWMNMQKLIPDIRTARSSRYNPNSPVFATNDNNIIRYYSGAFDPTLTDEEKAHITSHEGWHSDRALAALTKTYFSIKNEEERNAKLKLVEDRANRKAIDTIKALYDKAYYP